MTALLWAIFGGVTALALLPILATWRFRRYVRSRLSETRAPFTPRATVILPCKGVDPGFAENVRSMMDQDYPDYELIFVTATEDDPARACLEEALAERPRDNVRMLTAGIHPERSQKLNNQLHAIRHVRPDAEALVFVDSDVRAHPEYLRELVAPLADESVGATTGFRWYVPGKGGLGSYLRATWNGGGLPMLADPRFAYAWGGSMGIRRGVFERARVAERWDGALTDDFPLTMAVREQGLRVQFVPPCLLGSHEDSTLAETLEWTNRQTVICRVYYPGLWRAIFTFHAVFAMGFCLAAVLAVVKAAAPAAAFSLWPAALMFAVIAAEVASGMFLWAAVRGLLPDVGGWWRALKHAWLVPVAILLIFCNSVHSLLTRDVCWRGVRYRLHSPTRTEVLGAV